MNRTTGIQENVLLDKETISKEFERKAELLRPPKTFLAKIKRDPVIFFGAATTVGILTGGVVSLFMRKSRWSQLLMRARIAAQAITVVAIVVSFSKLKKAQEEYNEEVKVFNEKYYAALQEQAGGDYVPTAARDLKALKIPSSK